MGYIDIGQGKSTLVFLHGWTKKKEDYWELFKLLAPHSRIIAVDLPGFGQTALTKPYALDDYVTDLEDFLRQKKLRKIVLVGHSFGGRVAIKFVLKNSNMVEKLVLIDSAGIERKSLPVLLKIWLSNKTPQTIKHLLPFQVGSDDYRATTGYLRDTMKNIVTENLEPALKNISVPTLLVWGEKDHTTPLWQGRLMHKLINGSKLEVVPDGDHGSPYRKAPNVARVILDFLQ